MGVVDGLDGLEDAHGVALLLGGAGQGLDVFGEAASAVADAGVDEFGSDSRIAADPFADLVDVGPHDFAKVGDVVHERNLGRQHGVGGVLGHFGGRNIHEQHRVAVEREGLVEAGQYVLGALGFYAADDAVGLHEVVDGGAFFEELGVGRDVEVEVGTARVEGSPQGSAHLLSGTHGHRALGNDHEVVGHGAANAVGHRQHVLQVGTAVFARRRAHRDERGFGTLNRLCEVRRKVQSACRDVARDDGVQARFVDRQNALVEVGDFSFVDVHTGDVHADVAQAGSGDEADVAGSYYGNFHFAKKVWMDWIMRSCVAAVSSVCIGSERTSAQSCSATGKLPSG